MKLLVYGAGVLGSYLAYELAKTEHQVTLLARGKRYRELAKAGLCIEHAMQKRTDCAPVALTERLSEDDSYDVVFVVMQKTQLDAVLPGLAGAGRVRLFVLIGNNCEARQTAERFARENRSGAGVLFGFLSVGGRRKDGRAIVFHTKRPTFTVGGIGPENENKARVSDALTKTAFDLRPVDDMDNWLKYHLPFILPNVYAIYWAKGDHKRLSRSGGMLRLIVKGIHEAIDVLAALGYPPEPPGQVAFMRRSDLLLRLVLRTLYGIKLGRLIAVDHTMSAVGEMRELCEEFGALKRQASIPTPALDELEQYLPGD